MTQMVQLLYLADGTWECTACRAGPGRYVFQGLGHYITCYVTPRNMSSYHRPCDTLQHVSGSRVTREAVDALPSFALNVTHLCAGTPAAD